MEIDEVAARLLRRYWAVFLLCVALPLIGVGLLTAKQPPVYAADARIITGSIVPSSSTESDALVAQVQAIATGPHTAAAALKSARADRNLSDFIKNDISVTGLGGSQVVDLVVTDRNPQVAQRVAQALSSTVTASLNHVGQSGLQGALRAIDDQLVKLSQQRAGLARQVAKSPNNQQLQAKLAGVDEVIADFTGDRGRILIEASTQGLAGVIDAPSVPVHPVSKALPQKLGLAGLLGLVVGVLIASLAEVVRPTLPGAQRVSRRLAAPLLGHLAAADLLGLNTPGIARLAVRIRLASMHATVSTVALADVGSVAGLDEIADLLDHAIGHGANGSSPELAGSNSHNPAGGHASDGVGGRPGTLMINRRPTLPHRPVRFFPLSRMTAAGDIGWDRVGLLVLCGPVARVSDVATLAELAESSGWPVLGVAGAPRRSRLRRRQPESRPVPGSVAEHFPPPADPARHPGEPTS